MLDKFHRSRRGRRTQTRPRSSAPVGRPPRSWSMLAPTSRTVGGLGPRRLPAQGGRDAPHRSRHPESRRPRGILAGVRPDLPPFLPLLPPLRAPWLMRLICGFCLCGGGVSRGSPARAECAKPSSRSPLRGVLRWMKCHRPSRCSSSPSASPASSSLLAWPWRPRGCRRRRRRRLCLKGGTLIGGGHSVLASRYKVFSACLHVF